MFEDLSVSAIADAAAKCTDRDSALALLAKLFDDCGAKCALVYQFQRGIKPAMDQWAPVFSSFPDEINQYYRENRCLSVDVIFRAALSAYLPVRVAEIAGLNTSSAQMNALLKIMRQHGLKDGISMHVAERQGRLVYITLVYDRMLNDLTEVDRRWLHALLEMFMRHAGELLIGPATRRELSPKERDVLNLLVNGASNKEIARTLGIAETTVKIHVQHILRKLGLSSRVQAAVYAAERPPP